MTELEKMQRAKLYIDKLANGVDPITDSELPQDTVLNNVRLSRCFFYISDVLRQVIENGGEIKGKRTAKLDFFLKPEQKERISFSAEPLPITKFMERVAEVLDPMMKKLPITAVTGWLRSKGFLNEIEGERGQKKKVPTSLGQTIGISTELRHGLREDYTVVLYNEDAQHFIIDNIEAILAFRREEKERA